MTSKRKRVPKKIKDSLLVDVMHRCCLCPKHEDMTDIHHIVPINEKGPNTEENLMVVCPNCHAKIHRIRGRYTQEQLRMYKERWVNLCAKGLTLEERLAEAPGINLFQKPSLHNQTAPEVNFVGRKDMLDTITGWYKNPDVRIGGLIGWGGVGKSALVRKWYDELEINKIQPDGIFWWGFYRNAYLEQLLNALLRYVSGGQIELERIKSTWEKMEWIKEYISQGTYLIILDGLEQMQRGEVSGEKYGMMIHREFTELFHYLVDTKKSEGLCLITTRYELKDINQWYKNGFEWEQISGLSVNDSLKMLKVRKIKGTDEDLKEVAKRYKKHPLSLTSTAGYLDRYYDGEIKQAPDVEFVLGEEERFKDVNKLLGKYAERMSEAERVFLNIFSLFRQELTERDFAGVFRKRIESARFNDAIVEMNELDFRDMINGLVDWRLISYDQMKKTYTAHPLIKSYFESDFEERNKKICHQRIYAYFGENAPEEAETLEEMQPLFEQVYHGCAAGLHDEVFDNILQQKIYRENDRYLVNNKGAWETALSLVKSFFPKGNLSQMTLISKKSSQSWLINEAGLTLLSTGRAKEAEGPFLKAVQMTIETQDWTNASKDYQNLADLQFRIGEIESGVESANKALEMSEKAESDRDIGFSKNRLGCLLYLLGETKEAEEHFHRADELERSISGYRLYGLRGIEYAELLISVERIDEAFERTKQNIEICKSQNWPEDISRCHRCLGIIERIKGNHKKAENHLQKALEIAWKIGVPDLEIEALIESGRLRLDMGRYEDAIRDADNILKICGRAGFRLYEPGAEVVLAKAYLGQKDFERAEGFANSAYEKAVGMKYRWAEGDAADLLGEIYSVRGDKAKARKWLKKAVGCRKEILDPKVKETEGKLAGSE